LLLAANLSAEKTKDGVIPWPGVGCDAFAPLKDATQLFGDKVEMRAYLLKAIQQILEKHGDKLPHIKMIYLDVFQKDKIADVDYPSQKGGPLLRVRAYQGAGQERSQMEEASVYNEPSDHATLAVATNIKMVAGDFAAWCNNDANNGRRNTDDGGTGMSTNSIEIITNVTAATKGEIKGFYLTDVKYGLADSQATTITAMDSDGNTQIITLPTSDTNVKASFKKGFFIPLHKAAGAAEYKYNKDYKTWGDVIRVFDIKIPVSEHNLCVVDTKDAKCYRIQAANSKSYALGEISTITPAVTSEVPEKPLPTMSVTFSSTSLALIAEKDDKVAQKWNKAFTELYNTVVNKSGSNFASMHGERPSFVSSIGSFADVIKIIANMPKAAKLVKDSYSMEIARHPETAQLPEDLPSSIIQAERAAFNQLFDEHITIDSSSNSENMKRLQKNLLKETALLCAELSLHAERTESKCSSRFLGYKSEERGARVTLLRGFVADIANMVDKGKLNASVLHNKLAELKTDLGKKYKGEIIETIDKFSSPIAHCLAESHKANTQDVAQHELHQSMHL